MATQAVYYRARDGSEPVAEFLDSEFPVEPRKKNPTGREIKAAARRRMTIDVRRSANLFVLLHMLRKTSGAVPRADVEIAKQRWDEFKRRMGAARRIPPRAPGQDAP